MTNSLTGFFRDHHLDFVTVGGCSMMIDILEAHRDKFEAIDEQVSQIQGRVLERIGMEPSRFSAMTKQALDEMLDDAVSRYSSNPAAGPK